VAMAKPVPNIQPASPEDLQRQAYAALEQQRDFYENILNAIPLQISYVDKHQRIRYMNRSYESWFQLPLSAMQGRSISEVTTAERYRQLALHIDNVLGGASVEFEQRVPRADGALRDLSMAYVPHKDGEDICGFISVVRDVTEHKRLEASLQQSQKMEALGQLTGGMAHDFNNLLSAIIGNLQLLERPLRGHNRLLKHVKTSLHAALRGADLTRRLLAFARQTPLEPQVVDVNALMRNTQELLGHALGREIDIKCTLEDTLWAAKLDPCQFENCVLNLAINARDAMRGGGTLSISTRNVSADAGLRQRYPQLCNSEYVVVTVSDTGSGMTPDVVARAFEPFFSTKDVGKGTGLGLSMVYGFLEQSGGLATLHSSPGIGTTVRLYFPRAAGAVAGAVSDTQIERNKLSRGTETVLVVEDDADVRATAAGALRSLGYTALEAGSAVEAIEVLNHFPGRVDLLFSDIALPGGVHGPALARRVVELRPGTKVLFTSGFSESLVMHRGLVDGGRSLVSKPYALTDLADRVRAALDRE
jgi:PAS domain S-box-containing protein